MDNQQRPIGTEVPEPRRKTHGKFRLTIIALIILTATCFIYGAMNYSDYTKDVAINVNQASNISIDANANVYVVPTNGNQIKISINGKSTYTPSYEDSSNGKNIEIKFNKGLRVGVSFSNLNITVEVPRSYGGDFYVKTSSGKIEFDITNLENVSLNASSGKISIGDLTCNNFNAHASSGSIYVSSAVSKYVDVSCSSGRITIDSLKADDVKLDCSSGRIQVRDLKNANAKIHSSSGSIDVAYTSFNNDIEISGSSGSIKLTLPKTAEFKLDAKTSSGSVQSDFDIDGASSKNKLAGSTTGNPSHEIKLKTSSGSINIKKN